MSYKLTTEMTFDASHRLSNYEGKCKRIHGHTYRVIVEISAKRLNNWGAVLDFGELKKMMNIAVDTKYDHKLLLFSEDPFNQKLAKILPEKDWIYWMKTNTTAENIAEDIYERMRKLIKLMTKSVSIKKVTVYETPTNGASYQK